MMTSPAPPRKNCKKGNGTSSGQNIKVFVRVRPMNNIEKNSKAHSLVECPSTRDLVVNERPLDKYTKKFSFDRVFDGKSKQMDVYKSVAKPLVDEVLSGFNCTIFAYGQTGTGKTYTMEGDNFSESQSLEDNPEAGIIPRCVNQLFDELRIQKLEFTMRVSFLELYNEEVFDLLSASDDLSRLRLYEDSTRKGSCIIQGLEEVLVRCKRDVYNIIEKGSTKRQTAATMLNAHSSRSHTVFTVTVHIKENVLDGDELLKTGKLHLVDLAGSENIGRSGAVDKRAREAGNINQSLLTLGRVITSLVEKAPHVPYRESKLTRLLQDALGGRTKTSIIATVSPASVNLEETLSTLDYAHRAKNIQNRPEVNQRLNKKELIGEYTIEIERLRRDLMAMREKNGVYLANENYMELVNTQQQQEQEISDKINQIRTLEKELETKMEVFNELSKKYEETTEKLETAKETVRCTQKLLSQTAVERDEQKFLVANHKKTEAKLHNQGHDLINVAHTTSSDISKLHDKLDRKRKVECINSDLQKSFGEEYKDNMNDMKFTISELKELIQKDMKIACTNLRENESSTRNELQSISSQMRKINQQHSQSSEGLKIAFSSMFVHLLERVESLEKEVTEKGGDEIERLKSFRKDEFYPHMNKMRDIIHFQCSSISDLQTIVSNSITKLDDRCHTFCEEQSNCLSNMQKAFKSLTDLEATRVKCLNSEIQNMTVEMQKYSEFSKMLISVKEGIEATTNSLIGRLGEVNNKQTGHQAQVENIINDEILNHCISANHLKTEHEKYTSEAVGVTLVQMNNHVNELENQMKSLGEEVCSVSSSIDNEISAVSGSFQLIDNMTSNYKTESDQYINNKKKEFEDIYNLTSDLNKKLQVQNECLEKERSEFSRLINHHCKVLEDKELNIRETLLNHQVQLNECECNVEDFLTKQLQKDVPTGKTPVRREYNFPNTLAKTSPHDRLVARYHRRINIGSKIPLPQFAADDEDEEEVFASRVEPLNSNISPENQVTDNIYPENLSIQPLSRSSSCKDNMLLIHSHSQSESKETQIKNASIPRSSSISILDVKENYDLTSQQMLSSKKRELRQPAGYKFESFSKPELRPRKILGPHNQ